MKLSWTELVVINTAFLLTTQHPKYKEMGSFVSELTALSKRIGKEMDNYCKGKEE